MELGGWIRDVGEEGGPNLGSEEEGVRDARLSLLVVVSPLMSGIDTLHGTATDTPDIDVDALSIFTGTLEADAVCSGWAGDLLLRERFANPSFREDPAPPLSTRRSRIAKLGETLRPRALVGCLDFTGWVRWNLKPWMHLCGTADIAR